MSATHKRFARAICLKNSRLSAPPGAIEVTVVHHDQVAAQRKRETAVAESA